VGVSDCVAVEFDVGVISLGGEEYGGGLGCW